MISEKQCAEFKAKGRIPGGLLLSGNEVEELLRELDSVIALHDHHQADISLIGETAAFCRNRGDFLQLTNLWELSDVFRKVVFSPKLVSKAGQLAGVDSLKIFADSMLCKMGVNLEMNPWHRDGPAFDILTEDDAMAAWIALDDVDETNGAMCMIPGSHLWEGVPEKMKKLLKMRDLDPLSPVWKENGIDVEVCRVRKGEVHFHHGLTWHCSLKNVSGRPRRAWALHYVPGNTHYDAKGGHFWKPLMKNIPDGGVIEGPHWPTVWRRAA